MTCQVRWLIRRDMPEVLKIESECFDYPWSEEDFLTYLRKRNCIGMVAEIKDEIVGYMVYELGKGQLTIANFAVDPTRQRSGFGTAMVNRLKDKLSQQRRKHLWACVCEHNLDAQLFFAEMGFRAVNILRGYFEEPTADAYEMRYSLKESGVYHPTTNRISQYL